MVEYSYTIDTEEVDKVITNLMRTTPAFSRQVLGMLSEAIVNRVVVHNLSGPTGSHTLSRGTGTLAKSMTYKLDSDYKATVGSNVKYAAIHEFGGIIEPKVANALHFKVADKWVTTQRVVIPKREYLRTALDYVWEHESQKIMDKELDKWLDKEWK